jgi:CBS domain containing-hemolysin-like protein
VTFGDWEFTVLEMDELRISRILVKKKEPLSLPATEQED